MESVGSIWNLTYISKSEQVINNMDRVDKAFRKMYEKISSNFKTAFMSALIFGLIAHLYMFTNKLPNYDDMALNGFGATFRLGRWFLWVLGSIAYHLDFVYSLPLINGLLSIVLLAISAGIIVDLLQVESMIAVSIIAAVLVVFPSWTATFFFMFTAPYYAFAVFLMTLSVYIYRRHKYGYILSVCCVALSLGIYQAYLPFGATLYVVLLILELYNKKSECIQIVKKAVKSLGILIVGVVIYYILMKLSLMVTGQELADYKGTGQMGNISISLLPQIVTKMFTDGFGVVFNNNLEISYNLLLKVGYAMLYIVDVVILIISCRCFCKKKEAGKAGLLLLLIVAFLVSVNSIFIMCPADDAIYVLMTYAYTFLIILPICIVDKLFMESEIGKYRLITGMEYVVIGMAFLMVLTYCHFANAQYLSIQLSFEQAKGFYTTLITQIKSVEGYSDDMPIAVIESNTDIKDDTLYRNDVMDVFDISGRDEVLAETYSREYLLAYYCGFSPEYISADELPEEITAAMPVYPEQGSIKVIDHVIAVKLN